jgi:hypothetical protein
MSSNPFDPVFIVYQIICIQCFYYLAMGTLLGMCHAIFDINVSLDHFFTSKYINFFSFNGWLENFCIIGAGLIGCVLIIHLYVFSCFSHRAYLLSIIIEKSKKCVDFTFTLYFFHIVICIFYNEVRFLILLFEHDSFS